MPADLTPQGRLRRREAKLLRQTVEIERLQVSLDRAHDELAATHDILHAIVSANGRGALKLAKKHLGLD